MYRIFVGVLFLFISNEAQKQNALFCHVCTRFITTERPTVEYYNKEYVNFVNVTSLRHNRKDPFYYVTFIFDIKYEFHNNVTAEFVFYELLSNRYKRSFVEMRFQICDLIHKDKFFGPAFKQGLLDRPCPYPGGIYELYNMTIPTVSIPFNFPFNKGRIYINFTGTHNKDILGYGHIDMEIKESYIIGKRKQRV